MKFYVDQPLGGLCKWLRFLGFDVIQTRLTPQELRRLPAPEPDAYILTRQASLAGQAPRPDLIVLASLQPEAQVAEICRRLQLAPETWQPLNRCSDCNQLLVPILPEEAEGKVPEYISHLHQQFFQCPRCQRLFWEGSHQRRIRRRLADLQQQINTG